MLNQCPRCGNEEIEGANYCKICGLKLKEAPEVPAQELLTKYEMECIHRHLASFTKAIIFKKINYDDAYINACKGCKHYCSKDGLELNPWTTFDKLARLSSYTNEGKKESLNKQDSDHVHL
ncbi:hypothetical protein Z962_p0012 (plasmid) [Clostridium botulinum C/D str. BKT12695]|nr:hypothetical protein Z962_p0012 [Clostridium botulinum C/D str. BKT12695]